jgi:hypothetical protein
MIYPNGHIDYRVYKNGTELVGIARVKMPTIKYKTVTTEGAGLMGGVEIPLSGMIEPMSIEIDFLSCTDAIIELGSNEWHDIALYEAFQFFDGVTRTEELSADRFELSIRPTETNLGTIATASAADASGTYSVCKYQVYKDGEKVIDIDQFNTIHDVGGVDNAAKLRSALGMM